MRAYYVVVAMRGGVFVHSANYWSDYDQARLLASGMVAAFRVGRAASRQEAVAKVIAKAALWSPDADIVQVYPAVDPRAAADRLNKPEKST